MAASANGHFFRTQPDGSVVEYSADGAPLRQVMPDGTTYSGFDGAGRPHEVHVPAHDGQPAGTAHIDYHGNSSTYTYTDGTVATYDVGTNTLVTEQTSDGSVYTGFDAGGRPHDVRIPPQNGLPATTAHITYADGHTIYTYANHDVLTYDSARGTLLSERLPDGSVYTNFDGGGRPHHINLPAHGGVAATSADISYENGHAVYQYADGSRATADATTNTLLTEQTPDGSVFSGFRDGKPYHVVVAGSGGSADISYVGDQTVYTYADGTVSTYVGGSLVSEKMPDGSVFSGFRDGKPYHVVVAGSGGASASSADISYVGDQTVYTYSDGSVVTYEGKAIVKAVTPDGWTFNYTDGKPTSGTNEHTGQTVTIEPDGSIPGGSVWKYSDGTTVTKDADGNPVRETANGWTFIEFDDQGRPTKGSNGDTTVSVTYDYDAEHDTAWSYTEDGKTTTVVTTSDGKPVAITDPDGHTYQFAVEIPNLARAIKTVTAQRDLISAYLTGIEREMNVIKESWISPAGAAYAVTADDIGSLAKDVHGLLSDAIDRMNLAYKNYVAAETANVQVVTPTGTNWLREVARANLRRQAAVG